MEAGPRSILLSRLENGVVRSDRAWIYLFSEKILLSQYSGQNREAAICKLEREFAKGSQELKICIIYSVIEHSIIYVWGDMRANRSGT